MEIIAIVVTYNRKDLLQECLDNLLSQTYLLNKIIVINNHSTDGTENLFKSGQKYDRSLITCITQEKNLGGAGGFYEGIRIASKEDCDWLWIMDDDTIPEKDSLKELVTALKFANENVGFLASSVYGPNGEPMNVPVVDLLPTANGYGDWYMKLDKSLVKIQSATFVSILIKKDAVIKVGLPCKDYFIWGDDSEYTNRITKYYGTAYLCGKSKVLHKRKNAKALVIDNENNKGRIGLFYYAVRNSLINAREYSGRKSSTIWMIKYFIKILQMLIKHNVKFRWLKISVILRGVKDYMFKKYDYKQFKNRLHYNNNQIVKPR